MKSIELLIAGRSIPAQDGATFDRIDPFTGEVASRYAAASGADADAAVAAARAAFPTWSALGATERRKRLLHAADIVDSLTRRVHRNWR